jgi:transcriptional regulator with GAF, ATPase, and Fis domain
MEAADDSALTEHDDPFLVLASLFEGEFSIDWIQAISDAKATQIFKTFDRFMQDGVLKKHDIGLFSFTDNRKRLQLQQSIPDNLRENYRRDIADLLLNEGSTAEGLLQASTQLLHITNDLKGCRILYRAGDEYRQNGRSSESLVCYEKALRDLRQLDGFEVDTLFVKTVIAYSKDHRAVANLNELISYLHQALERAERWNNTSQLALVLMHLASNINFERKNFPAAKAYFDRGFALAKDINDPEVERTVITGTIIREFYSGRMKSAIKVYETSEPLFTEKYPMHKLSLRIGVLIGIAYAYVGRATQGLGLMDGIRLHTLKIKDYDTAATATAHMAMVLMLIHRYDEAIVLLKDTFMTSERVSDYAKCIGLGYLACCYFQKGEINKSERFLNQTMKKYGMYSYEIKNKTFFIEICAAMERGDYPRLPGISPRQEIQKLSHSNNIYVSGTATRTLAVLAWQEQKPEERFKQLMRSLTLLEESGFIIEIAKTKLALGRHFLQNGDVEKAKTLVIEASKVLSPIDRNLIPNDLEHLVRDLSLGDNLLEEIFTLSEETVGIRDIQEVVQHIFSALNRITGAERAAIFLQTGGPDPAPIKLWAARNLTGDDIALPEFSSSLEMIHQTAKTGKPRSQMIHQGLNGANTDNNQLKSRICVPLLLKGKTIGVLYLDNRFFESTFEQKDVHILSYFASIAAIGIDNAQAYEEIRRLNQRLMEEKQYLEEQQSEIIHSDNMVTASPAIKRVMSMIQRVAETESTVLILGETGVGKEIIARAIQQQSRRCDKPFIRVHCGVFPESLITSELFGHERGAFTGAVERRIGRFELADGGTLFLDEIGEISKEVQVLLLRVLQTGEFERVGGRETLSSDFRLIVATNRNLAAEVAAGRFREDLYYRLNVFPITVPPLRERREDISPLANYFLRVYSDKLSKSFKGIPEKEMAKLLAYHWPGNVRELENVIERGVILNAGPLFYTPELVPGLTDVLDAGQVNFREMERRIIIDALKKTNWKIFGPGGTAELLGINHNTLYSKMKKLGIKKALK